MDCVSMLEHLIPLAGGSLAISLSYLNLERFRYSQRITKLVAEANERLALIGSNNMDLISETRSYKELQGLASFLDGSSGFRHSLTPTMLQSKWSFPTRVDTSVCILITAVSLTALALGSAHAAGLFLSHTCHFFSRNEIQISFWVLLTGSLVPVYFTVIGDRAVRQCNDLSSRLEDDLSGMMKAAVPNAGTRDLPPGSKE